MEYPNWFIFFSTHFTAICLACTALLQILPTPLEITHKYYVIFYNIVQRASLHRPTWKRNGEAGK